MCNWDFTHLAGSLKDWSMPYDPMKLSISLMCNFTHLAGTLKD